MAQLIGKINNSLAPRKTQESMSKFINSDAVQKSLTNTIKDPDIRNHFATNVITLVNTNPQLQGCDNLSIVTAALAAHMLNLEVNSAFGQASVIPFDDKNRGKIAVLVVGYKGYVKFALNTNNYTRLNVLEIKEGELEYWDPLNEKIKVNLIQDFEKRESAETIGYYACFELANGFFKPMYWSKKQMKAHALKYSQGYRRDLERGTQYTFWSKDFDAMARKTMLRQLISKWDPMSTEMINLFTRDGAMIKEDLTPEYVDNPIDEPTEEPLQADEPITPQDEAKETTKETKETKEPKEKQVYTPKVTFEEATRNVVETETQTQKLELDEEDYQEQQNLDLDY